MLKDRLDCVERWYGLDERLRKLYRYPVEDAVHHNEFKTDNDHSVVYGVERGSLVAATGWRENRENREVSGAVKVEEGEFVLFLPGEKMAVSPAEGSVCWMRRLK